MYARLDLVSQKLQYYGLHHLSSTDLMLQRMSGETDPRYLKVLASVVQPPEGYEREQLKPYDATSPLNRLVDAVPPESETARRFGELTKRIIAGTASPEQWQEARDRLVLWRDNDVKLQPLLENSDLTAELVPVSHTLSQVASIGLQALGDLRDHHAQDAATLQNNLQILKAAEKPEAVLRDMVAPSVESLEQATAVR
jgi:hexosaminidase